MPTRNLPLQLPQLSPRLESALEPLCMAVPAAEVARLSACVAGHLQVIKEALRQNEFLDLELAEAVTNALLALLADYAQCPADHQALIAGACRYFVRMDDIKPDTASILGLDDDAEVLNYVLETIGRTDLKVEV